MKAQDQFYFLLFLTRLVRVRVPSGMRVRINLRKGPRGILSYWLGTPIGDSLDGFASSEGSSAIFELFETAKTVDLLSQKKSVELLLIVCLFVYLACVQVVARR